jgi:hypothetical protein
MAKDNIVVGFIGLATMGGRMAANLQKAGYKLVVHERRQRVAEPRRIDRDVDAGALLGKPHHDARVAAAPTARHGFRHLGVGEIAQPHRQAEFTAERVGETDVLVLSVYRLPEAEWSRRLALEHTVAFTGGADLPVYVRVTQADAHQAWSSPIYPIE